MDATAIQFEKHWRTRVSQEILQYDEETHQCYGHGCSRCAISSELRSVAAKVSFKE